MNRQKFYIVLALLLISFFAAKAFASLTLSTNTITGTTGSSIDLGSNIILLPHDVALQGPVTSRAMAAADSVIGTGGFQVVKEAVDGAVFPSLELVGYQNGQTAQMFNVIAKAGGTAASPTTASANATIGGYRFVARQNGAWRNVGNLSASTSATFSDSDQSTRMLLGPSTAIGAQALIYLDGGNGSSTANTIILGGQPTPNGSMLTLDPNTNPTVLSSWGTRGILLNVVGHAFSDAASSGTVATAVANSFGASTFTASSATTFTNAANLYIAGDIAAGTNVTLTNSYGLWNTGKTRLEGSVNIGTATPNANAILDVASTTKAFMPPRMTKTQRDAIPAPTTGMVIYQTDNIPGLRAYNGANWMRFTETAD